MAITGIAPSIKIDWTKRRRYSQSRWDHFPISLHVTSSGSSKDPLLCADKVADLYLVRICAIHNDQGSETGDTVLRVAAFNTGAAVDLGTLTLPQALATLTLVESEHAVKITPANNMILFEIKTDGGHREIFATAWFAQSPLRD